MYGLFTRTDVYGIYLSELKVYPLKNILYSIIQTNKMYGENLINGYIDILRENQRLYASILQRTAENEERIFHLITRSYRDPHAFHTVSPVTIPVTPIPTVMTDNNGVAIVQNNETQRSYTSDDFFRTLDSILEVSLGDVENNEVTFITTSGLTETQASNFITTHTFSDLDITQALCPISQQAFLPDDRVSKIHGCGHVFNKQGLDTWITMRDWCPVCRQPIDTSGPP